MNVTFRTIPLRLLRRPADRSGQWICNRCVATQADAIIAERRSPVPSPDAGNNQVTSIRSEESRQAWVEKWIAKELPHRVPIQYLQHCTSDLLPSQEKEWRAQWPSHGAIVGVVVSAGKMDKTVKVRIPGQRWEDKIRKYFSSPTDHLVHDANNSLREGDVVNLHRLRVSSAVHHVVASIISAFGPAIDDRPKILTPEERLAEYKFQRFEKLYRRALRVGAARGKPSAIERLQSMGLLTTQGSESSKGGKQGLRHRAAGTVAGQTLKPVNARALRNRANEIKFDNKTEQNREIAKQKDAELEGVVGTTPESGTTLTRGRDD